jgi:hypothetical protein
MFQIISHESSIQAWIYILYTALAFQNVQNIFSKSKTGGAVPNHMLEVKMN